MPRQWKPSPNDAMSLGAFRWFANALENAAVELYATDRETFHQSERVLRAALKEMAMIRAKFAVPAEENGCPDGYVLCNGLCAPSCDWLAEAASAEARALGSEGPPST